MHGLMEFAVCLSVITIAGTLIYIALELQRIRRAFQKLTLIESRRRPTILPTVSTSHHSKKAFLREVQAGFAIYVFRDGHWHLEADLSAPGCEATPPLISGTYHGQVVRKESSLKK